MSEKFNMSFQVCAEERAAIIACAEKEKRTIANYMRVACLDRGKDKHGVIPEKEEE